MLAMAAAQKFADSFKAFPPRQKIMEVDTSTMFTEALSRTRTD